MARSEISATMADALEHAQPAGLVRWPGGFWTFPGDFAVRTVPGHSRMVDVPNWHVGWGTIQALLDRGLVEVTKRALDGAYPVEVRPAQAEKETPPMADRPTIPVIGELRDIGEPEPTLSPEEQEAERARVLKMLAEERANKKAAHPEE